MKTLAWNCRGLGSDLVVRHVKEMIKKHLPDLIYLMETKQHDSYIRGIVDDLQFENHVIVPPNGLSGGLVVMWRNSISVSVLFQSSNLVDCLVDMNGISFYLSCVYGHPDVSSRNTLWESFELISQSRTGPVMLIGDFNEIRSNQEKKGGNTRPERSFRDFRRMIQVCDLVDLRHVGNAFSWTGKRGSHNVQCCLDRSMVNREWLNLFPASFAEFGDIGISDDRPVLTVIEAEPEQRHGQFRYDSRFEDKCVFRDATMRGWNRNRLGSGRLSSKFINCRKEIARWKRGNIHNAREEIYLARRKLQEAIEAGESTRCIQKLRSELSATYANEEKYWKVRSRNKWLNSGDKNTRFFYASTKARRVRNRIKSIVDEAGQVHYGPKKIGEAAEKYFTELFTTELGHVNNHPHVSSGFTQRVSGAVNDDLTRPVTEEEIHQAIFSIGATKAPGPDDFNGEFFYKYWDDIKEDIISEIKRFFEEGDLDNELNHTNICLIPKTNTPNTFSEFRPISLCNVSYKVISKILVSRLKPHLSSMISKEQAAFIPGRMITDNVLLAHEVMHSLKVRKRCSSSYMAIKTDITKAYDRIEWDFIRETMRQMGFSNRWIEWVMICVRTVTFSVNINGARQ